MPQPVRPTPCPACQQQTAYVIETRHTGPITRRRRRCSSCDHRFTTYELHQEHYKQLLGNTKQLRRIEQALSSLLPKDYDAPTGGAVLRCSLCKFASGGECSLGYPEYGTPEAADCVMFEEAAT